MLGETANETYSKHPVLGLCLGWEGYRRFVEGLNSHSRYSHCLNWGFPLLQQNTVAKKQVRKERIYWLTLPDNSSSVDSSSSGQELEQGWKLKAAADAKTMEGAASWPTSHGLLSLPSDSTQDYLPRDGPTHSGL